MDLAELNAAQREAVMDLQDNILLLAPAGTGKTNTLACRIANILEQKRAEPEEILCLTFTNKACREMKERIIARAGEAGAVSSSRHSTGSATMSSRPRRNAIRTSLPILRFLTRQTA